MLRSVDLHSRRVTTALSTTCARTSMLVCGTLLVMLFGCADVAENQLDSNEVAIEWASPDDPWQTTFSSILSDRLSDIIREDAMGIPYSVPELAIPYPNYEWPHMHDGIAGEWHPADHQSPLVKFIQQVAPSHVDAALRWEGDHHGAQQGRGGVEPWEGHCHASTLASIWYGSRIRHPVTARYSSTTEAFERCEAGTSGCTTFLIPDLYALAAEAQSLRYPRLHALQSDETGRPNAGSFAMALSAWLGPRAADLDRATRKKWGLPRALSISGLDEPAGEIWSRAILSYSVVRYQAVDRKSAARLVAEARCHQLSDLARHATHFALVVFRLSYVDYLTREQLAAVAEQPIRGDSLTKQVDVAVLLELVEVPTGGASRKATTRSPSTSKTEGWLDEWARNKQIVGGSYVTHEDLSTSPRNAPRSLMTVTEAPHDDEPIGRPYKALQRNPYVTPSMVEQLISLSF